MVKEKWKVLRAKYQLPDIQRLKQVFRFEVESDELLLEDVRNRISSKLALFSHMVEHMIGSAENFCCLYERGMLSKREKLELFQIYRRLQSLIWESNYLSIVYSEERMANWIQKVWRLWNNGIEKKLSEYCEKLSSGWIEFEMMSDDTIYHG